MKRGEVVLISMSGDYGKPRPALIVQTDLFSDHPSVTVCLVTSHLLQAPLYRHQVEPHPDNGLQVPSQIQIDKLMTVPRQKIGPTIGRLTERQISEVTKLLALWIGIAD